MKCHAIAIASKVAARHGRGMSDTYAKASRVLHWLIAVMVLGLVIAGLIAHYDMVAKPLKLVIVRLHISFGLTLLALMAARLGMRLWRRPPALPAAIPAAEQMAARLGHGAMYALLFAMPVVGVIFTQAHGRAVSWFGVFTLPALVVEDKPLRYLFAALHFWGGWVLLGLVALHIGALFWHRRQGIWLLPRMWG